MNAEQRKSIKALCQRHMVHTDRSEFAKQAVPEIAKTLSDLGLTFSPSFRPGRVSATIGRTLARAHVDDLLY